MVGSERGLGSVHWPCNLGQAVRVVSPSRQAVLI